MESSTTVATDPLIKEPPSTLLPVEPPKDSSDADLKAKDTLPTDTDPNPEEQPADLQETDDVEMTENSDPCPDSNPDEQTTTIQENDVDMIETSNADANADANTDSENVQTNNLPQPSEATAERQLTLEDVELFPDEEKEMGTLNKGEDLSIEDFNLGESELNDLAENLVQEGWDI